MLNPTIAILVEGIGWAGAAIILLAYVLVTIGRLTGRSAPYQWLNLIGAAGIFLNSGVNGAYPSAALNLVWMGIGAVALWSIARARGGAPST